MSPRFPVSLFPTTQFRSLTNTISFVWWCLVWREWEKCYGGFVWSGDPRREGRDPRYHSYLNSTPPTVLTGSTRILESKFRSDLVVHQPFDLSRKIFDLHVLTCTSSRVYTEKEQNLPLQSENSPAKVGYPSSLSFRHRYRRTREPDLVPLTTTPPTFIQGLFCTVRLLFLLLV